MAFRGCSTALLILVVAAPAVAWVQTPSYPASELLLSQRERKVWKIPVRASEFTDVPHVSVRPRCENTQPPQALTPPDPLLGAAGPDAKVKVSFIVGSDGRVHGPLILESAGPARDRSVLRALRSWRYRPATCDGAPTEAEGKIEFSRGQESPGME